MHLLTSVCAWMQTAWLRLQRSAYAPGVGDVWTHTMRDEVVRVVEVTDTHVRVAVWYPFVGVFSGRWSVNTWYTWAHDASRVKQAKRV